MSKIEEIKFEPCGIGDLIKNKFLFVPAFQRSYAWEEKEVTELFQDIIYSMSLGEYFIGSIVISSIEGEGNLFQIIDGQQRIATTIILLSAIRNYYISIKEDELVEDIEKNFIRNFDRDKREYISKLCLNSTDNNYFQNLVINRPDELKTVLVETRESHTRIKKAFEYAKMHIESLVRPYSGKPDVLINWTNFIEKKVKVITVVAPGLEDAYTIFETLNDRGKALATTDLIKNYLFQISKDRISEIHDYWTRMIAIIEAAVDEEEVETYIKYYWSSVYGFTRIKDRNLFKKIKNEINSPYKAIDFSIKLNINSERYVALLNQNHPLWNIYDPDCRKYISILNTLKLTQYIPLMLAVLEKFNNVEIKKSLKFLIDWFVRNLITGSLGGGTIEQIYSEKAVEVNNNKIRDANNLVDSLKGNTPQDETFKEQFSIARVSQSYLARYYLKSLENQKRGEGKPELVPNEDINAVNLEHILPQNPSNLQSDWPSFNVDTHLAYYRRIGNLALLSTKLNNIISNGPFINKKVELIKSDFLLTKSIAGNADWTINEINTRQKELAELAVITWNLKI